MKKVFSLIAIALLFAATTACEADNASAEQLYDALCTTCDDVDPEGECTTCDDVDPEGACTTCDDVDPEGECTTCDDIPDDNGN
ncbi:hypothetical protein OZ410_12310 [Robiginitalea sp. M366]|uniref:hypothetical protein n=1 Tax=Robiginitalea aestuariiviva TaxID=3036903 RepID=UPI00240E10FC|nr:hypothetical protein [Robiginitalea aestuariiviva]MDG1573104.1 hypothetical protein [Robiginitalea aestuariiviva]